ncbi:MAG: single-stranded DNA-binding protein [Phycisphaerales bacterium]|nr:single-stranded DNA-binding protein [Phycisphaerales bacterium]
MASFNKVILLGNLTRDPQLRYLPSNVAVCDFGLAVNRHWRDRDGNQKEETCFVDVSAFGKQGETINQYMTKGRPLLVEGHLKFDTWTGQDGQKRSKLSVIVDGFQFVGGREGGGSAPADRGHAARDDQGDRSGGRGERAAPPDHYPPDRAEDLPPPAGDDIPF